MASTYRDMLSDYIYSHEYFDFESPVTITGYYCYAYDLCNGYGCQDSYNANVSEVHVYYDENEDSIYDESGIYMSENGGDPWRFDIRCEDNEEAAYELCKAIGIV